MNTKCLDLKADITHNPYYARNSAYFLALFDLVQNYPRSYFNMLRSKGTMPSNCTIARKDVYEWIELSLPLLSDPTYKISTKCYWILNGLEDFPVCKICKSSENYKLKNINATKGYEEHCCCQCASDDPAVSSLQHTEESKRKGAATYRRTVQNRTPEEKKAISEGNRKRVIEAYRKDKAGILERRKQTYRKNYGCDYYLQTKEAKDHTRECNRNRFGSDYYFTSQQRKDDYTNPDFVQQLTLKRFETMRVNNTFKQSNPEQEAFNMLSFIFPHLQRQYYSEKYPFHADFFDPSQPNLRFEFQGTWTHGFHPFDPNDANDIMLLDKWKSKGTKYFINAIDTWTRRDPEKRRVAHENGITLIEFWNLNQVRDFVINFDFTRSK